MSLIDLVESGRLPDWSLRPGIRALLLERLWSLRGAGESEAHVAMLKASPLLVHAQEANDQHYEVESEFFKLVLGPNLKYSSCYFADPADDLGRAEEAMLALSAERAGVGDGMSVLDLGCGWGSMTRYLLKRFPHLSVTALSNSTSQREFISASVPESERARLKLITGNIAEVELESKFDRVISIEMFEHCRNYQLLLRKISDWLTPDGELFVHIFTHRSKSYLFDTEGDTNWMGRYFFTGGQMPAHDLLTYFQDDLVLKYQWRESGLHYQRTADCWLENFDQNSAAVLRLFVQTYGDGASLWFNRWRLFFLAVSELFGFWNGEIWGVSHYRFGKR